MRMLWRREWNYQKKELCFQLCMELLIVICVFIIYKIKKSLLFTAAAYIMTLPEEVYAFLGLPVGIETGNFFFYIRFMVMIFNVWVAWSFAARVIRSIWREEKTGNVYIMCNQWYSRKQLVLAKYLWSIVSFLVSYIVLFGVCLVFVLAGSFNHAQRMANMSNMSGMLVRGTVVIILILSVCASYAMCVKSRNDSQYVSRLIIGTLLVGNLYKVRDFIFFLMAWLGLTMEAAEQHLEWLNGLFWLSPLSWINPYIESPVIGMILQMTICICLSGLSVLYGCRKYQLRSI